MAISSARPHRDVFHNLGDLGRDLHLRWRHRLRVMVCVAQMGEVARYCRLALDDDSGRSCWERSTNERRETRRLEDVAGILRNGWSLRVHRRLAARIVL